MANMYGLLKVLHVLAVVIWIGGVTALWTTALRLGRAGNRAAIATLLPIVARYGQRVAGPASGIVLITGIVMAVIGHLGQALWVQLGMAGILLHFILGATLVRRSWSQVGRIASEPADDSALAAAVRRSSIVSWTYLLLMAAVIATMVLKPGS
jgi:uncharacterized membrane protein